MGNYPIRILLFWSIFIGTFLLIMIISKWIGLKIDPMFATLTSMGGALAYLIETHEN